MRREPSPSPAITLTASQEAAAARILYALEQPGGLAVLCGSPGVGKTTVLEQVADAAAAGLKTVRVTRPLVDEEPDTAAERTSWRRPETAPDMLLCDDAHHSTAAGLVQFVDRWRTRHPRMGIVLAGEGRLLSLVAADGRLARAVGLRAVVPPFTFAETGCLLRPRLSGLAAPDRLDEVIRVIHEIAAGSPGAAIRLAEMAVVVAAGRAGGLVPATVETVHRRLCLEAA